MFSQKLRHVEDDELRIDIDPCYEADPYELKLDEMIDAEPEPEVIEGLPASDALTPADRYLELFTNVQKSRIFADSKTFPDCAPKHDPLDILRNYRKVKRQPDFDLRQFVEDNFWLPESQSDIYISDPQPDPERTHRQAVAGADPRASGSYPVVIATGAAAGLHRARRSL
ncbi:hypothetical protein LN650_03100 [Klebsiella pneumoniae subsp. pneumoniae]|nr:hypothetical protein [Klebsiella pneumoniae subsp. pneumoniae]